MASFEDWGGKGLSKMNLSGRDSALHTWADLRQRRELSMFSCTMLKETAWILGRRVTLSKNTAQAAGTFFATVLPEAELQGGHFNQDIEIFVQIQAVPDHLRPTRDEGARDMYKQDIFGYESNWHASIFE